MTLIDPKIKIVLNATATLRENGLKFLCCYVMRNGKKGPVTFL